MSFEHQIGLNLFHVHWKTIDWCKDQLQAIYLLHQGKFQKISSKEKPLTASQFQDFGNKFEWSLYLSNQDLAVVRETLYRQLQESTRRLSVGHALERGLHHLSVITEIICYLYDHPYEQKILTLLFQTAPSFCSYLQSNVKLIPALYRDIEAGKSHFIYRQPIMASLYLVDFLTRNLLFNEKETQDLFVISLLKDIGMSIIPKHAWDRKELDVVQQRSLSMHANHSVHLLKDRLPIHKTALTIIEHHHFHNDIVRHYLQNKQQSKETKGQDRTYSSDVIHGIETALVAISDLIVAMQTTRPYRPPYTIANIQNVLWLVTKDHYPTEEKILTKHLHQFFE